jgi:crossover junction endodeoxyribonuclease RuvC
MSWLSIDPGAKGAIAWWGDHNKLICVEPIPYATIKSGGKSHGVVDVAGLRRMLEGWGNVRIAWMERVGPSTGSSSSFYFGRGVGALEGFLGARSILIGYVTPATWQKGVGIGAANKDASRVLAGELYPAFSGQFARVKDDGRAEAVLIGHHILSNTGHGINQCV